MLVVVPLLLPDGHHAEWVMLKDQVAQRARPKALKAKTNPVNRMEDRKM